MKLRYIGFRSTTLREKDFSFKIEIVLTFNTCFILYVHMNLMDIKDTFLTAPNNPGEQYYFMI